MKKGDSGMKSLDRFETTWKVGLFAVFLGFFTSCATGITSEVKKQVSYTGPFEELSRNPEGFKDKVVLVGGRILEVNTSASVSEVIVLQHPLDVSSDRPKAEKGSKGRFILQSQQFLDPEVYRRSYLVTVAGKVIGKAEKQVGDYSMTLPKIEPIEVKLWPPAARSDYPAVTFGVGVGTRF